MPANLMQFKLVEAMQLREKKLFVYFIQNYAEIIVWKVKARQLNSLSRKSSLKLGEIGEYFTCEMVPKCIE